MVVGTYRPLNQGEVGAILGTEIALWIVQSSLENHYGPLLVMAFIAFKAARKSRDTQLYCLGASLIVLVYLMQR